MAFNLQMVAAPGALITAINAVVDSGHPGQAAQLARAKTAAVAEVTAHNTAPELSLVFSGHHDNNSSRLEIIVDMIRGTSSPSA